MKYVKPEYADYDAPRKFQAIQGIIARRLLEHPNAICSYSGGSDSDTMLDLIERTRKLFSLPPVDYAFFNTGLEMEATKRHVRKQAEKYGVKITEYRPKINIVQASRKYGIPFMSKIISERLEAWQRHPEIPIDIATEFDGLDAEQAKEKFASYQRKGHVISLLCFLTNRTQYGEEKCNQTCIASAPYLSEFMRDNPPDFKITAKCCDYCKKSIAHEIRKNYELEITGERNEEGGARTIGFTKGNEPGCFRETSRGTFRLRPLFYVTDADKAWYKEYYGLRYSDAYEVYGMKRTGCCGCPISWRATEDLEKIGQYEPYVAKAAWNIFGKSYEYRKKYNAYKTSRRIEESKLGTIPLFTDEEAGADE